MGQAHVRQWDSISGTGPCASVGQASVGQAHMHQWDRHMCSSGITALSLVGSDKFMSGTSTSS